MTIWKTIDGFPDYEISSSGQVRRLTTNGRAKAGTILKTHLRVGYQSVCLTARDRSRPRLYIHHLVADHFLPPRPSPKHEVAHNDGTRTNSDASNLRWATRRENMADKLKHGTHQTCEKHPNAKLTIDRIFAARRRQKNGETLKNLAAEFGVHRETLFKAVSGETWKPIAGEDAAS